MVGYGTSCGASDVGGLEIFDVALGTASAMTNTTSKLEAPWVDCAIAATQTTHLDDGYGVGDGNDDVDEDAQHWHRRCSDGQTDLLSRPRPSGGQRFRADALVSSNAGMQFSGMLLTAAHELP